MHAMHKHNTKGNHNKCPICRRIIPMAYIHNPKLKASEYIKRVIYTGFAKSDITCLYPDYEVICVGAKPTLLGYIFIGNYALGLRILLFSSMIFS